MFMPMSFNMNHRKVLIVGGGTIAYRKAEKFIQFGLKPVVVAPRLGKQMVLLQEHIDWLKTVYEKSHLEGVDLVVAATDDDDLNESILKACKSRSIWCLNVSNGADSDFQIPAMILKDPIHISISTQGMSPGMAKEIKRSVEAVLDETYVERINEISKIREILKKNVAHKNQREKELRDLVNLSVSELKIRRQHYENYNWNKG